MRLHQGITGRYKFRRLGPNREVRQETPWMDNLITDRGLNNIGEAGANPWRYCSVGTGTNTPQTTDVQLQTFVGTTQTLVTGSTSQYLSGSPDFFASYAITFEFAAGAAEGNLSEVGVGRASNGTELSSRALIVDGTGSPTTITVLADEILQVTFERRNYIQVTDITGTVDISGTSYNYTLRAAESDTNNAGGWSASLQNTFLWATTAARIAYDGPIGTHDSSPSGTQGSAGTASNRAYVTDSFERVYDITWALDEANFGTGIKSIKYVTGLASAFQIEFDPAIPKDNTQTLTLTVKQSWGRL